MNYKMIRNIIGYILVFEALFLLIPVITAIYYHETEIKAFLISMGIMLSVGGICVFGKAEDKQLYSRDGYVIVALSWIVLSFFGAIPFHISGVIPHYVDAVFETMSGFTTTGATILEEIESLPKSILMWRSFTHWIGGMGVLVFIMAFIPLSGATNMRLMKAESTGPSVSKLVPKVKTTALILYSIYFVFTLAEFVLLLFGGMSVFDAITTSFSTAGTGGFGTHNDSMLSFSPYIQIVVGIFMLLFSINFGLYYYMIKGRFKEAFNEETRTFFLIFLVFVTIIVLNTVKCFDSIGECIRHVFFTVSSLISSTGFATVDFDRWPELSRTLLLLIMISGACAGSTGGGAKVYRVILMCKSAVKELSVMIHPKLSKKITVDKHSVDHEVIRSVNVFFVCYFLFFVISLVIVTIDNYDIVTNISSVMTTLNNMGPGLNLCGPTHNFAFFSDRSKIIFIIDMLAGRLEIFPVLILLSPSTYKK